MAKAQHGNHARRPRDENGKIIKAPTWMRVRYILLYCAELGKVKIVDTFSNRLMKMRIAVGEWADDVLAFQSMYPNETRMVMVLLTYAGIEDYQPGHINLYIKDLKRRLGNGLITFAWVAEIQDRGAVHYHMILLVRRGTKIPLPDKSGMWKYGLSGIHTARTPWYLAKYTGKEHQKDLARYPKSCRLYAVSPRLTKQILVRRDNGEEMDLRPCWPEGVDPNKIDDAPAWVYAGSSVTKSYAESLVPENAIVVK